MRFKFLLFAFLLWAGIINAQPATFIYEDTINYLVISEYRGDPAWMSYLELTNMGDEPVQLNQFKMGHWGGGETLDFETGKTDKEDYWIPVDKELQPGESYVFAAVSDWNQSEYAKGLEDGIREKSVQDNMWEAADFYVHIPEAPFAVPTDSVTPGLGDPVFMNQWGGNGIYIEQHFANGDSMVIDQVGGMFNMEDGTNPNRTDALSHYSVAGFPDATRNAYLIRRYEVKTGTLNFNEARGVGLDDSEWIPIPFTGRTPWRLAPWTVGNHGDYNLDENTLESDVIDVDFAGKTLTVPWGVRRGDDIMSYFEQKPGIGWYYVMGANADSLTHAAQTGDQLLIYVCGDVLDFAAFDIVVSEPATDANMVVPRTDEGLDPDWVNEQIESGQWAWPRVTKHESGNDTIWGERGGIPFATRVDTLLQDRLDKPSNAEWEIVYASGVVKPDLSNGDILKVTAEDGSVKEYYISVNEYRANTDATLSSITWPDIPDFYKGLFGWVGDTIPGFSPQVFNYNVQVPLMADGIPALVASTSDINAKLEVDRATSLSGDTETRTVNFKVTAEDDTTENNYSVTLSKEKNPGNLQPFFAEPFISEVINNNYWTNDGYVEIVNPGNQPLDLSKYMIIGSTNPNPADAIQSTNEDNWLSRYDKYIPGYKWTGNEGAWAVQQYMAQVDLSVPGIMQPGDVFVLGATPKGHNAYCNEGYMWPVITEVDVQFMNADAGCYTIQNQWGEEVGNRASPANKFRNAHIYLFKILNDSINQGLKPATDPNDFELIDVFGMGESTIWTIAGTGTNPTPDFRRKPDIYKGNPVAGISMGVNSPDDVEWNWENHNTLAGKGFGWPDRMTNLLQDLGKHFMYAPTHYISTVSSLVYKVSDGYKSPQEIRGMTTGTTVSDFINNVIKADSAQTLAVTSASDGMSLNPDEVLSLNDTLTVLSADSTNATKYVLEVTDNGLSSNAVLTSNRYNIEINQQPAAVEEIKSAADNHMGTGTISGFEYGTAVQTVVGNVTLPAGATMTVINEEGAYIPMKMLNFDSTYVTTTVNADTYFEVIAENGITSITYQLLPQASESSAFVTSNLYSVVQGDLLIEYVPRGTNVQSFLSNVIPSFGASMKVVDKWGFVREKGVVADDDKLVVTSADETVTTAYHISKLATEYIPESTYLAYILSNAYSINQVDYKIYGVSGTAAISEFYSRIEAAVGATAVVVDENGVEKTSGDIDRTDMVQVTSADGKIVVNYTFGQLTGSEMVRNYQIELYPNPSSGKLNVTGLQKGQQIKVFNSVGSAVLEVEVQSSHEILELNEHPAGMYLIVVSENNQLLGKYKAIKH